MTEMKLKGEVAKSFNTIDVEFGRIQAEMNFSSNGTIQRKLKLKDGNKVEIVIRKL